MPDALIRRLVGILVIAIGAYYLRPGLGGLPPRGWPAAVSPPGSGAWETTAAASLSSSSVQPGPVFEGIAGGCLRDRVGFLGL